MERRRSPWILAACAVLGVACQANRQPPASRPAVAAPATEERIPLDPEVSPVSFRWLAADAVLVKPKTRTRSLAGFGNYVSRSAKKRERSHLEVWDDEDAWKRAASGDSQAEAAEGAHRRAEYLKESSPEAVDRYTVFDPSGRVVYQRDFRAWPLTELD